jgi:hypothetical protein
MGKVGKMKPPYTIWSFYDMLSFSASNWFFLSAIIESTNKTLLLSADNRELLHEDKNQVDMVLLNINAIEPVLKTLDLQLSCMYCSKMRSDISDKDITCTAVARMFESLQERIGDESKLRLFMHITHAKSEYFTNPRSQFGETILERFPSIVFDVEEAGKCFATGRNTASVFHLGRVMEVGLRAIGSSLNILDPHPTWDHILKKCDAELAKPIRERLELWKTDDAFFSEATANLRAVKNAWRNPTMHIGSQYSDEVAEDISHAVRGFMRHLATKLSEEQKPS